MQKATPARSAPAGAKPVPKAALLHLDDDTNRGLGDIFKQFGVQAVVVESDGAARLQKEKFHAIVVRLEPAGEELLHAARNSPSNRRVVVYGLGKTAAEAMRYSKYGINAILNDPIERQAALKVVRATYLLVIHELRRYVRIPIVTPLKMTHDNRKSEALTVEISAGGMCVSSELAGTIKDGQVMDISFELPGTAQISVGAAVCWRHLSQNQFGLHFDPADDRRLQVKHWIEDYLESF